MQHVKFTNIFEASLQAVNPSVSLPYWDFTIDQEAGNEKPFQTVAFTAATFGTISMPADYSSGFLFSSDKVESAAIPDGKWAGLAAEFNTKYEDLKYGYGYMRAPWSMNPSPYISRYTKDTSSTLPSCKNHYDLLHDYGDSMTNFFFMSSFAPHATVHGLVGSMYGCDVMDQLLGSGYITSRSTANKMCASWPFVMKGFYREGYFTPKKNCELNTTDYRSSHCGFDCDSSYLDEIGSYILRHYADEVDASKEDAAEVWAAFVCSGDAYRIYPGDHIESASPADPSFWVVHPTLERLLQARLMVGGFDDETWPSDPVTDFVCSGASCLQDGVKDYHATCCDGHFADSQLLNAITGQRFEYYGPTNLAVLTATDPRSAMHYSMPYVYDSFSWSHCKSGKYDIEELLTTLRAYNKIRQAH